jgi:predicted  nucleic acid-binding Zn-ribbon protein
MVETQPKLPGVGPTSTVARRNLCTATEAVRETTDRLAGLKEHLKAARSELETADSELASIERDLVAADVDGKEWRVAEIDHGKAWKRYSQAERGIENLKSTIVAAENAHKEASRILRAAREDLESVRLGRRKR